MSAVDEMKLLTGMLDRARGELADFLLSKKVEQGYPVAFRMAQAYQAQRRLRVAAEARAATAEDLARAVERFNQTWNVDDHEALLAALAAYRALSPEEP